MLVNSISFWIFFLIMLVPYWWASTFKTSKCQNIISLIASFYFYAQASYEMCFLLVAAILVFYVLGICIEKFNKTNEKIASALTNIGVCAGVGLLIYFKFLNFFIDEFAIFFNNIGLKTNISSFGIIMPLGISFFTFKLISYVVEVHRENIRASISLINFGVFVAFFPTIMSGPIDRPGQFLPQLETNRKFLVTNLVSGLKRILWGAFLKMCIADQLSGYTDAVLNNYMHHNTYSIIFATFLYSFQMYTDFCGYSEMALGVGQIMGVNIRENFNRPFWAQNVAEYWRRWHMSLTTWLTDYVFMPLNLAFRNMGNLGLYLATLLNLIIVGFWHGANWTYGLFGVYHGVLLVLVTMIDKRRKKFEKKHNLKKNIYWIHGRQFLTFTLCTVGFLIFRSQSASDVFKIIGVVTSSLGGGLFKEGIQNVAPSIIAIILLIFKEYKDERKLKYAFLHSKNKIVSMLTIVGMVFYILLFGALEGSSFIYFQF